MEIKKLDKKYPYRDDGDLIIESKLDDIIDKINEIIEKINQIKLESR